MPASNETQKFNLSRCAFIVGAGAHSEYDMPTSAGLHKCIRSMLEVDTFNYSRDVAQTYYSLKTDPYRYKADLINLVLDLNIVKNVSQTHLPIDIPPDKLDDFKSVSRLFERFVYDFCHSHAPSIDRYLSNLSNMENFFKKTLYAEFGKLTIAYFILKFESKTYLGSREHGWIHSLIKQLLIEDPLQFIKYKPAFITFNYDRILERTIYEHLKMHHHYNDDKANDFIKMLNIFHVYGSIGEYTDWFNPQAQAPASFYRAAISRIRVIGEDRVSTKQEIIQNIYSRVNEKQFIYFLGFGFDTQNNDLLLNSMRNLFEEEETKMFTTSINVNRSDLIRLQDSRIDPTKLGNLNSLKEVTCKMLLEEIAPPHLPKGLF